jgi:hypothetical protein
LVQLRKIAFGIIHSTTIVLPLWFQTLEKLKLEGRKMPRDVATRWNSTFDMLAFALQYRAAIDDITGNKTASLRQYELSDEEWTIAEQLRDTLKVRRASKPFISFRMANDYTDLQGRDLILFPLNAYSRDSNPCHGSH